MASEFPENELREFIYLDDESINSHLSSLGVGLETGRTAATAEETERSSRFAAVVPTPVSIGGSVSGRKSDSEETEKQVDITVPYRFQELIRQIKDDYEIKMPEREEEAEINYGDVIAVEGVITPMSLFRFEISQDAILTMNHSTIAIEKQMDTYKDTLEEHGLAEMIEEIEEEEIEEIPIEVREEQSNLNETFSSISKGLTGKRVPVRIDSRENYQGNSYGAVLDRDQLRVPVTRAFFQPRRYTVFGRVEQIIAPGEEWDPIDTTRVVQSFADDSVEIDEFIKTIQMVADENEIEMKDEHLTIDGKAIIIDPLAVYW